MIKKFQRILSGVLAAMFVGQVMIYGDGSSQGIAHAETIAGIKESLQLSENADELQQEFESTVDSLGEVDYFENPEEVSLYSSNTGEPSVAEACGLSVSGYVGQYGTYSDLTKVKILIFDGWDLVNETTASANGFFTVAAYGLGSDTNVKIECDGYLPRFYKGMGYGSSDEPEMLLPGDTTWNEEQSNQWSDEQINSTDTAYVQGCLGAYVGDSDFNPSMDADGDNIISQADLNAFCAFYENLGDTEYELPQYICDMDMNADGVINETDYEIFISNDITEEEYNNFDNKANSLTMQDEADIIIKKYGYVCKGGGSAFGGEWKPKDENAARFYGEPNTIKENTVKTTKGSYKVLDYYNKDGKAVAERHLTDHNKAHQHSNPHDHLINWDNNFPNFYDKYNYFDNEVPSFEEFVNDHFGKISDYITGDEKSMKNYEYNPADHKFETLGEFKFYLSCGANVAFEYNNVEYGIEAVFGTDGKKQNDRYCIWNDNEDLADGLTLEQTLDYEFDGVKLRDFITTDDVAITERIM